ncbi:uncharacterized protein [Pleurodeles waltl]|uniref:uncharacterized protein isoform X1 n=1 Tax=Pleurodeles waltl TaxID=8319 RepID=UPI003709A1EF
MASEGGRQLPKFNFSSIIVEASSPANQYLLQLLDDKKTVNFQEPTEARTKQVFEILDSVIPQLGVFSPLLTHIKVELNEAVYSPQLTGNPESKSQTEDILMRVPYFSLYKRRQDERNEELQNALLKLDQATKRLLQSEKESLRLRGEVADLHKSHGALQNNITVLQEAIQHKDDIIKGLNEDLRAQAEDLQEQKSLFKTLVREGELQLHVSRKEINTLKTYRSQYQELQHAFQSPLEKRKHNVLSSVATKLPAQRKSLIVTEQAHANSYLKTTNHLYRQLLLVQNSVMDDFDTFVERYSNELLSEYFCMDGKNRVHNKDLNKQLMQEEMARRQDTFRQSMEDITIELSLLCQQKQTLEQHVQTLEKGLLQELHPGASRTPAAVGSTGSAGSSRGLPEPEYEPPDESVQDFFYHMFYPDERALNKYAAMGYISCDGGKTYKEIEGAKMCISCGEKTLVCPHKVGNHRELVLPQGCSRLRISRPQAHAIMLAGKLPHRMKEQMIRSVTGLAPPSESTKTTDDTALVESASLSRLEAHFEKQLQFQREEPRGMSLGLCRSFTERLIASLLCEEEGTEKRHFGDSVQEVLSRLFNEHYQLEDVSSFGLQDFLSAVWKYSPVCREIAVLGHVLLGDLDPAVLRYVVLMADLLNSVSFLAVQDFRVFVAQVYPFLQGDYLDNIILDYSSFSENRMSRRLVMEFILKLILQNTEPLFVESEDTLMRSPKTQASQLSSKELNAATEDLAPLTSEYLRMALIQQSTASLKNSTIPIRHAAQITSYLIALQQSRVQKEHLKTALEAERSREGPEKGVCSEVTGEQEGDLISISKVRFMAKIMQRMAEIRTTKGHA